MRLLLAAVLLSLGSPSLSPCLPGPAASSSVAQESRESETIRYRGFGEIIEEIARAADSAAAKPGDKVLVVWLVDNASMLQTSKHGDLLAEAIPRAFGTLVSKAKTYHAVLALGAEDATLALRATDDFAAVSRAVQALAAGKPDDRIKNCMAGIRSAAKYASGFSGKKFVVLFTQENGDNEDNVEVTLRFLKDTGAAFVAVAGEAVYSDPYWEGVVDNAMYYSSSEADKYRKLKFQLRGPESAYVEFPYGWPYMSVEPAYTVPSGFGYYGLDRLATHTGGKYYLYNVDRSAFSFCQRHVCAICSGTHKDCGGSYDVTKLRMTSPEVGSREQIRHRYGRERLFVAILNIWERLYRAGLVRGAPRLKAGSGLIQEIRPPSGGSNPFSFGTDWRTNKNQSLRAAADLEKIIAEFSDAIAQEAAGADKRILATAEALLLHLRVLKFNLGQLALFCDEMDRVARGKKPPPPDNPFAVPAMDECNGCRGNSGYSYRNFFLCHGGAPLKDVRLLGGDAEEKEKRDLLDYADATIEKHRGTPWEILVRRAALVLYSHGGD